jgi:hypothetical protein
MKDNRHLVGSGGGTRTPDTRIMIVTLDSDQTPPLASTCTLKNAPGQPF